MLIFALAAVLALQAPPAEPDTLGPYDAPATRELVEHAIAVGVAPEGLDDYRAQVRSSFHLTMAADSAESGELPVTVDELVSTVRWQRGGWLHQTVRAHRMRALVLAPYTLATLMGSPWVIPHLYQDSTEVLTAYASFGGGRAVHPFGPRGPHFYHYAGDAPVQIRVRGDVVTLVPITVRPRQKESGESLLVGTFWLDADRGAVARARFTFVGGGGRLSFGRTETFVELENALWEGRYWLPFRQRRDFLFSSAALGSEVAGRVINHFEQMDLNVGWSPTGERVQLAYALADSARFAGWPGTVGEDAGEYSTDDFRDLRLAARTGPAEARAARLRLHWERTDHLFRYNRVEGPYIGIGGQLLPADPRRQGWRAYGTLGWAFAQATPRGELSARWEEPAPAEPDPGVIWGAKGAAYRRLRDILPFRPTVSWDLFYSLPALFWGSDRRDYYDATGVELFGTARRGPWHARLGGRREEHRPVKMNTGRYLFGSAEGLGPLADSEPGTHAALEAQAGYARGPGAFGIGNSTVGWLGSEIGWGDFHFNRLSVLLSARRDLGPLTVAARVDGGHAWGEVPPQKLFLFGANVDLRGYDASEFGGSTALLARSRVLVWLPPRTTRPLARLGFFLVPPLRPALVFLGETGWTRIEEEQRPELQRLRVRPTDGALRSVGFGLSLLDDVFRVEWVQPVGPGAEGRDGQLHVNLMGWQ